MTRCSRQVASSWAELHKIKALKNRHIDRHKLLMARMIRLNSPRSNGEKVSNLLKLTAADRARAIKFLESG
jgi:hypothetical protein